MTGLDGGSLPLIQRGRQVDIVTEVAARAFDDVRRDYVIAPLAPEYGRQGRR
ncbi:MAG: hypothetical protein ACRDRG_01515 [Pseudonocardiaceae bacterium]